jgi:hypothetical protein
MQIWSKDERPVRFDVLDADGKVMISVDGSWLEIVPLEFAGQDKSPTAGKPEHSLVADVLADQSERLADHIAFAGPKVTYRFFFGGRAFDGPAIMGMDKARMRLVCAGHPVLSAQSYERRAS